MGPLSKLVTELLAAISALSGYPLPEEPPAVEFLSPTALEQMACGGPCEVYGWYPFGATIYLDDRLEPLTDMGSRAVLLHELVHYLQQESGAYGGTIDCALWLAREREAYDIQIDWLVQKRFSPKSLAPYGRLPRKLACDARGGATAR